MNNMFVLQHLYTNMKFINKKVQYKKLGHIQEVDLKGGTSGISANLSDATGLHLSI